VTSLLFMLTQDVLNVSDEQISIAISPQETDVKAVEIFQLLRRVKNNRLMEIDENIVKAADLMNQVTQDNSAAVAKNVVIAKAMHATLSIDVVKEDMKALVTINAAWGGQHITIEDLNQRLGNHGIIHGLCSEAFEQHITKASSLKPGQELSFDAAYGSIPINGKSSIFTVLVNTMEDRELKPQTRSNGKVDMHDLGKVETVSIDTPLVRRTPPTLGKAGFSVFGIEKPAIDGQEIPFQINEGTQVSRVDNDLLVSSTEGIPRLFQGNITVHNVLTVNNVDIGLGNIEFKGNINIKGDVGEGMSVISQGDITVGGCVNSANLHASGNITVAQGIFGKKKRTNETLTCNVSAGGSVSAQYIQYSQVTSGKDVTAQTQLLHSHVTANENVVVANKPFTKGTIFGGKISARKTISTVELGGNSGSKTHLTISADLYLARESIDKKQQSLSKEFIVLQQLIAAHDKVSSIKSQQEQQVLLKKLKRNIDKKVALIVETKKEISQITENIKLDQQAMTVTVKKTLYDGVHIVMDEQESQTIEQYQAVKITLVNNAIDVSPLTEK